MMLSPYLRKKKQLEAVKLRVRLPPSEHQHSTAEMVTLSCSPDTDAHAFHAAVMDKLNRIRRPGLPVALQSDFYLTEKKGRERSDLFELPAPKFYKALSKLPKNQDGGTNATTLYLVMARQAGLNTTKTTETDMVRTDRPGSPTLVYRFEHDRVKRAFEQCVEGLAACNILFLTAIE